MILLCPVQGPWASSLNVCHVECMAFAMSWKTGPVAGRLTTQIGGLVTLTDCPKSVCIRCKSHCYVAVCNNYAICNTLQTALNCNAVCNTSYFKLRCEGNAICNVLQIASKLYHLKILKRRKKLINCKMHRFNIILLWIQLDTNLFELGMHNSQSTTFGQNAILSPHFWEIWRGGA